jgi:hypothetical protein
MIVFLLDEERCCIANSGLAATTTGVVAANGIACRESQF